MSVLFDIILIIILAVCAVIGWKKGFIRALRGFITYILSFAVANTLYRVVGKIRHQAAVFAEDDHGCGDAGGVCKCDFP